MNLLVVYQHYNPEPFRISDICEALVARGHQVTVVTGLPNYPEGNIYEGYTDKLKREELINGVKVIRCPLIPRGKSRFMLALNYLSFAFTASLRVYRLKEDFNVVYAHQTSPVLMVIPAIIYKRKHRKKLLIYCLDPWPDSLAAGDVKEGSLIYRLFMPISKWIYAQADRLAVSSYSFKKYFVDTFGFDQREIQYIPQYAEDIFSYNSETVENSKFNLVFAGNIGKAQSVDTIIKAANMLKGNEDLVFNVVGSGSDLERCQKLAGALELENVIFHGRKPLSEMPDFYKLADAMLITLCDSKSFSYTLPGKVQSYMAAGKAIIAAANGETERVINEAQCGFCCPAEDFEGLSQVIVQFCQLKDWSTFAINSRKYYDLHFSKDRFMIALEEALIDLESAVDV